MPVPVLPNVWQARLVWSSASAPRRAVNDLYFLDEFSAYAADGVNGALAANFSVDMWKNVTSAASISNIQITKLDGVTASTDFLTGSGAQYTGDGDTDLILQGSQVVTLRTGLIGRSHRGRIYLPWIGGGNQISGVINAGDTVIAQAGWTAFHGGMTTAGLPPVVVSRVLNASFPVTSITVQPFLKTQRRRAIR